ncbi:TetR/AcrR family transcriptional regulator [Nocardia suismassiliense]|uniref:TetR/AcrR family transcriptional regulator n=1 Tax=Nocardia suismassiliense TaxID=2077092 RepID=UPI000D1D723B|nr:TetR/AcrR family transcriptional regulator [Nocardia suismassiliense]
MGAEGGLRERKKQRTRTAIADTAIEMFLESGFDEVSCAEIAARAEVSKPTLFKYFPTKEDLVLHRIIDHEQEAARVVRDRRSGEAPLNALRRHFLAALDAHDPITGLNDDPEVLALHQMFETTPSLSARVLGFVAKGAEELAAALVDAGAVSGGVAARVAAHQVIITLRVLAEENLRELAGGRALDEVHPEAVAAARRAFAMLRAALDAA